MQTTDVVNGEPATCSGPRSRKRRRDPTARQHETWSRNPSMIPWRDNSAKFLKRKTTEPEQTRQEPVITLTLEAATSSLSRRSNDSPSGDFTGELARGGFPRGGCGFNRGCLAHAHAKRFGYLGLHACARDPAIHTTRRAKELHCPVIISGNRSMIVALASVTREFGVIASL